MMNELEKAIERLDDYVRGHLEHDASLAYEDELFGRALAQQTPELDFRDSLANTLTSMKARGTLDLWLTAQDFDRLLATTVRVRHCELSSEGPVALDLTGEFDVLVTKIPVDLRGVRRLDAEVVGSGGEVLKVMPDIAFEQADGAIYGCCERELALAAAGAKWVTRLWAIDDDGRRLLRELVYG